MVDSATVPRHSLHHRIRKLAARQELRRLATQRHQVGFGEDLQDMFCCSVLNGRAQVDVGTEQKDIQQIRQAELRQFPEFRLNSVLRA